MGNTCGCVDPAEKDAEVKVDNNKGGLNQHRQAQINNYRDSTLSKNQYAGSLDANTPTVDGIPQLF